jgi:CubicO group peptidase (beta-lactamase class C family)
VKRSGSDEEAHVARILDELGITPEYFRDLPYDVRHQAVSTVDAREPALVPPPKVRWPVSFLFEIDIDKFNRTLQSALNALAPLGGVPVGYCYMIKRKGQILHAESKGSAQLPDDPQSGQGNVVWDTTVPMNIASVSKFVTAIAVVRLLDSLQSQGVTVSTPIGTYLPQYWAQGSNAGSITFHQLLRHEAGLGTTITNNGQGDFAEAKKEITAGTTGSTPYNYKNVNYAILRVLFATLTGTLSAGSSTPSFLTSIGISDDTFWDVMSEIVYTNYVNDYVFAPAGIARRDLKADANAALAYATPPTVPGARIENLGLSGQTGWHLSIEELVQLLDKFQAGAILSRRRAHQLKTSQYGLEPPIATNAGPVYSKGGLRLDGSGRGLASMMALMPGDIEFAIFVNSGDGTAAGPLRGVPDLIVNSPKFSLSFW